MAIPDVKRSKRSAQPFPSAVPLAAVHHLRRMQGGTQAHLMYANNGRCYVIKFQNNPIHPRILANEFLATRLALNLHLPVASVEIIEVSEWLISHIPKLRMEIGETATPCRSGLQLGSLFVGDPEHNDGFVEHLAKSMFARLVNRQDFALMLAFDKWVGNCDNRQAVFVKGENKPVRYRAVFLDQGYCFNAEEWTFPDLPLMGAYDRNWPYHTIRGWESFEPMLSQIESMDYTNLWNVAVGVPHEWYQHDSGAMWRLIESLYKRRTIVRDLITRFRRSDRNPFPNWTRNVLATKHR